MTSLLIMMLAAFALLGVIIVVFVKTTRLRLWQGVLIFLLPLLLANLLWFSWLKPQRQQSTQQSAAAYLSHAPGYRVLRTQEPALWQLLVKELEHNMAQGKTPEQATGELRGWLINIVNQRLMRAPDKPVVGYVQTSVTVMQTLSQRDRELCFRFLYPQVSGGVNLSDTLPPALAAQETEAVEQLLLSSVNTTANVDRAQAQQDLQDIVATLYKKWGNRLKQLNLPADASADRAAMCAMSIDLYQAILALPEKRAANLLRKMVALPG